jgi:hypothetical protein
MTPLSITPATVGISPEWLRRKGPELARDIVCGLDTAANLAIAYALDANQWAVLKDWPAFRQMVAEANEELSGSAGTPERARRKAALAIAEVGVVDMATIMGDPKASHRDRIAAFGELKDIGMLGSKVQAAVVAGAAPAAGYGGPLIQIVVPNGATLNIGEAEPIAPLVPVLEGTAERVG